LQLLHLFHSATIGLMQDHWNTACNFMHCLADQPLMSKLWIGLLFITNCALPLVFIHEWEARLVGYSFASSFLTTYMIFRIAGWTRLLSLSRMVLAPMLAYLFFYAGIATPHLYMERGPYELVLTLKRSHIFHLWLKSVLVIDSITLFMDVANLSKWLALKYSNNNVAIDANANKRKAE